MYINKSNYFEKDELNEGMNILLIRKRKIDGSLLPWS